MTRRHDALIPLTHDHHHALAQTRRLKNAAKGDGRDLPGQSQAFLDFFHAETVSHFREEEEVVFPLAVEDGRARELLVRALMEHLQIHALVSRLEVEVRESRVTAESASEIATALEAHIRFEEGEVFPLLEEVVAEDQLSEVLPRLRARERVSAEAT
jgi:iron-sulfur cluster repair protein YtfE (RIC family)